MISTIQPSRFLELAAHYPVVDVRSPGEFIQGHVPGAISIPLFDDAERAIVGTGYVQSGKDSAILLGLNIALTKVDFYVQKIHAVAATGNILVHCWRGGMRSTVMAEVFGKAGFNVEILTSGYKAYRRFIRNGLANPARIVVLGGFTGSGKTELLHEIALKGEQVIDLEQLACHKGSVFGALGQPSQPTNEQFENNLYAQWEQLDFNRAIWLENESRMIGNITLPEPVFRHISNGTLINVEMDSAIRISRLVKEYAGFDRQLLTDAVRQIGERLGGSRLKEALNALENGRFMEVSTIVLAYYDKAYLFSLERRQNKNVQRIEISGQPPGATAAKIIKFANKHI